MLAVDYNVVQRCGFSSEYQVGYKRTYLTARTATALLCVHSALREHRPPIRASRRETTKLSDS